MTIVDLPPEGRVGLTVIADDFVRGPTGEIRMNCRVALRATRITTFGIPDPQSDWSANEVVTNSGFAAGLTDNFPPSNAGVPYSNTTWHPNSAAVEYELGNVSVLSNTGY